MNRDGWRGEAPWHLHHYEGPLAMVLDVGAFTGEFTVAVLERGARRVVCFEPDQRNLEVLKANLDEFRDRSLIAMQAGAVVSGQVMQEAEPWGLAVTKDGRDLRMTSVGAQSSGLIYLSNTTTEVVSSVPFAQVLQDHEPIDYLKIDIEGGEFELFDDEVASVIKKTVRFLEVEIHGFASFPGPRDMMGRYSRLGDAGARDELIRYLQRLGFMDEPCPTRKIHAGAFCSRNHSM